jgi:hypothetical protein
LKELKIFAKFLLENEIQELKEFLKLVAYFEFKRLTESKTIT